MQRALNELVAALRRAGVAISTAESIDALRAVERIGLVDRAELKRTLSLTLVKSARDVPRFSRVFEGFFDAEGRNQGDLYQRLRAQGFEGHEVDAVRELVSQAGAAQEQGGAVYQSLADGQASVERLIESSMQRAGIARVDDPARLGFATMRVLDALRFARAEARLSTFRIQLRASLGERGDALADALSDELSELRGEVRQQVSRELSQGAARRSLEETPFTQLTARETQEVERAVRELAERLLGRALVRARHARRGRLHVPRTLRRALATGGVPFEPQFHGKRRRAPKLVVLCDVSDSVKESARFMLLFTHVAQRLFAAARSYVFVGEVRDATEIFRSEPPARAIELAYRGAIVNVADNSHYGRVFRQLAADARAQLDSQTTLLVLGDGRSNHFDPGEQAFAELCSRVARVVWLTPEPESRWSSADSALPVYRRYVDQLLPVYDLRTLRIAARELSRF
ncbi:MAG TPA: VWA domain-containing protein [Polyangiales bacterium]